MKLDLHDYMKPNGLFAFAFQDLRKALNQQAETLWQENKAYSPWVLRTAKGGTGKESFLVNQDVSLYRHCMDISIIAFMLFIYAWKGGKLPQLAVEPKTSEEKEFLYLTVRRLFAIAFCHDANKYPEQSTPGNPTLEQVEEIYRTLNMEQWTELPVKTLFAAACTVQQDGQGSALFSGALLTDPLLEKLRNMVRVGDALTSIGSKEGLAAMLDSYNQRLNENNPRECLQTLFNVPNVPLQLISFRYSPVVLHILQRVFVNYCHDKHFYPLVCLLDGERLYLSVPADAEGMPDTELVEVSDISSASTAHSVFMTEVFSRLETEISDTPQPQLKRSQTNGEVKAAHIHTADDLITAISEQPDRGLLSVQMPDWDKVQAFVQEAWQSLNSSRLVLASKPSKATGIAALFELKGEGELPAKYLYALAIAAALRMETNKKLFEERVQRLLDSSQFDAVSLKNSFDFKVLHKNTVQTLLALQTASHVHNASELDATVQMLVGEFPPVQEDTGSRDILRQLKQQCGLATLPLTASPSFTELVEVNGGEAVSKQDLPYQAKPKGGTCLLCGDPTLTAIETSRMNLAGIKKTAFNNRIGHRKHIWSQSDKNYLCPACVKQQDLLCGIDPKLRNEPLLAAVPFQGLITPTKTHVGDQDEGGTVHLFSSFTAVKPDTWQQVLPWNRDLSDKYPFVSESIDNDLNSVISAMERWAKFALHSGNPVHVFISHQRDCKPAFVFEQMPALIQELIADLVKDKTHDSSIRRDQLPAFIRRMELFRQILNSHVGREVLSVMPAFKWWAVAWLHLREEGKKYFLVKQAKEEYPMSLDGKIEEIARLAQQIQKRPDKGWDASGSEISFALSSALQQFHTGRAREASETATIAAMTRTLATDLQDRRGLALRIKGDTHSEQFYETCHEFCAKVYDLMNSQIKEGQSDARFQRFLASAYAFLFMEKRQEKAEEE